ncbi:NAD-dependent epimerase/dehydratase family protein [Pseudomonas piscis]|uniref:NAD-dependent epimerase/dehydratase family protein n=1 Tax=Pseudomonas piscis TaxID=2614538 RepID=UPI0003B31ADA|nr:NAD-dependent epimerase/dehydratase family protein [Pseudomonas piscis]ERO63908.1 hypothetical protein P308_26780 [Pseudomonas piscis]
MEVAILGASSHIAKDLIFSFAHETSVRLTLFCRQPSTLDSQTKKIAEEKNYQILEYSDFTHDLDFDVIINFVGIGDPAKAASMGSQILQITEHYDELALSYLKQHSACKYIFLSSGAVYGGNFTTPVNKSSPAIFEINDLKNTNWYAIAKLYAETKHRALQHLQIVDLRVFNYFSHTADIESRFLITDMARAILRSETFYTSDQNITRDIITPRDFFQLVEKIALTSSFLNQAIDCYSSAPADKLSILEEIRNNFSFTYILQEGFQSVNATGFKLNYYSLSRAPEVLKYRPTLSSIEGLIYEIKKIPGIK